MSLTRERQRRGASITSLIDVIFLLLLFFMLASTFSKRAEIEFAAAATETRKSGQARPVVRLLVLERSLEINGRPTTESTLAAALGEELTKPDAVIAVQLSDSVTTQRLIDILLLLGAIPGAQIQLLETV